jgi:Na+/H+-dicarboxylate symporter
MGTTVLAVILGIILVIAIHPGRPTKTDDEITKVHLSKR